MNIKWRLGVLVIQVALLLLATQIVTGHPYTEKPWFIAGLLAVVVNPMLLEPFYPRPGDVIANSIIFAFLYLISAKQVGELGWKFSLCMFCIAGILATFSVLGKRRARGVSGFNFAEAARSVSLFASAQVIYSSVFFLDLLDYRSIGTRAFWMLAAAWAIITFLGKTNWQRVWTSASSDPFDCVVESLLGPSVITVTAMTVPPQGTWVTIRSRSAQSSGLVIKKISRRENVWAQLHVAEATSCEQFVGDGVVELINSKRPQSICVGSVAAGSTDVGLQFIATESLRTGQVVAVPLVGSEAHILYQLVAASIEHTDVKGGSHLFERAQATQLGLYDVDEHRFRRHLWVPGPGAPVLSSIANITPARPPPASWEVIGHVVGTQLPVFLDLDLAASGHVAILGMTKMGKSTLAARLAKRLAETRSVIILDLTGEYVRKKLFPHYDKQNDLCAPGLSVFEPKPEEIPADRALAFFEYLLGKARPEYETGTPLARTVIIDEAHQFIPEPAGLGFNTPGRDSSFKIGLLLMQIRKYGISVILISQRTAVVAKSALSQCENLIAFRSVDQTGLDYLEAVAGNDVRTILPKLRQGEALAFGPAVSAELPVVVNVLNR